MIQTVAEGRTTRRMVALGLAVGAALYLSPSILLAQEVARVIPAAAVDSEVSLRTTETAVLAGGCFWGVQGIFQHVKGVTNAVSGYAGGDKQSATYDAVSSGRTGHAEAVRVTFDPRQISYGRILQIYFSVAHDPTQLNRQGPDSGTQYRSTIFTENPQQAKVAKAYIAQLDKTSRLSCADRHHDHAAARFLRCREIPPGFPDREPDLPLYRDQRSAEDRKPAYRLPRPVPPRSCAGRDCWYVELGILPARSGDRAIRKCRS
jgi:peptide-methionine (S)-S-oxide reductase